MQAVSRVRHTVARIAGTWPACLDTGVHNGDPGMVMLMVISAEDCAAVATGNFEASRAGRKVRPALQILEVRLGEWVVIAGIGPAVGLGNAQVGEQLGQELGSHRGTPVGRDVELRRGGTLLGSRDGQDERVSGIFRILGARPLGGCR